MHEKFIISLIVFLTLLISACSDQPAPVWESGDFRITLADDRLDLYKGQLKILDNVEFAFNFIKPAGISIKKTTSNSLVLKLHFNEKDGFYEDFPAELLLTITRNDNGINFSAEHERFRHITVTMNDQDEHYFGLIEKLYPNNTKNPDLRGNTVDVEIYAYGNRNYSENYASAYSAFYMSSRGYGSFFDTFAKGRYQLAVNGKTELYHQTDRLDWYVFYGPTGDKIHEQYFKVIGRPKSIPIWACGPIFWRDMNFGGKDEILDDIQKFTDLKIPLTACWVDRPYSRGAHEWSKMDFAENFAEPEKWIKTINEKYGMEFMTWVGSLTFSDMDFPGLLPNYMTYIDLTDPAALTEFEKRLFQNQYTVGVRGHKMDRADEYFPMTAKWHEPISESLSRNKYVYLYSKVIDGFLEKAWGADHFNFARAAYHRTQPYLSAVWGGDSRSNWLGMAGSQANAMRCGFMGFPVWGNDTGGYLGEGRIAEKLYIRWLQWSAWNGMFEVKIDGSGGSGEDRPPWKYSEQLQSVFRELCQQRMYFLPFIFSVVNTSYKNGVAMKPLSYCYPDDPQTYHIWDEYIFGNAFLIAPVFTEENRREIYLPEGRWVDFNNPNKVYTGPTKITMNVPLKTLPIFLKLNSIYVTGDIFQGNSKIWESELNGKEGVEIHLVPGNTGEQADFDYVDYCRDNREIAMTMTVASSKIEFNSAALATAAEVVLENHDQPEKVLLNGNSVAIDYSDKTRSTKLKIPADTEIHLEIY